MSRKAFNVLVTIMVAGSLTTACTQADKHEIQAGKVAANTAVTPDPKADAASPVSVTPQQKEGVKSQEQPASSQNLPTTPLKSESPSNPSNPKSAEQAEPKKKPAPDGSTNAQKTPVSWYYMKKGKGRVPDFPKETKTFTPDQKAVWVGTGKHVYLTFDNGGPMGDTNKLLKTLKDNDVKATFFIAGYNLKAHPDFLKQLVAEGHLVANHSMSHKDFTKLTDDQAKQEITDFEQLYKSIVGKEAPKYFRFPYGSYSMHELNLVSSMGYTSVFWSTAMKDWVPRTNGSDDAYNDIMNNLHDGNVILMHQGSDDNIEALDRILKAIKKEGYEFKLVSDLQPPAK